MEKHEGASFFAGLREKQQERKAQRQEQKAQMGMTPFSNGTGSGRPNFGQFAQKAIGNVMGGQKMGDAMGFRQGVNDKLDQVLSKLDPAQSDAGTPPADPMVNNNATAQADAAEMMGGLTGASASAKKIAKKQAKQYAAVNNLSDKQAKSLKKEAKKSQSFDPNKNEHADTKPGGDKNKTVSFGGSMKDIDPPKGNTMKSDNTSYMSNRKDINQMKGSYAGLERRESSDPKVNFSRMNNKDLANKLFEDKGFYSDKERKRQVNLLGYDEVSRPGPLSKIGQTIAKGPNKPKPELKATRTKSFHKKIEPKKKLMATKTVAKFKKKPLQKVTPRPAKKL